MEDRHVKEGIWKYYRENIIKNKDKYIYNTNWKDMIKLEILSINNDDIPDHTYVIHESINNIIVDFESKYIC